MQTEKNERENSKDGETESDNEKDKLFQLFTSLQNESEAQTLFDSEKIHFNYSACLSLPEIPPELS
ncbi:MAG TPA: hypothetical protein VN451_00900 [Chitinophagaceae bacterium]|nr:hypothetical protein [Chitinophagaceae bacterium]